MTYRVRFHWALAAMVLVATASCSGAQVTEPLPGYPFAQATRDCAPFDGPAVTVVLRPSADSLEAAGPQLRVSIWLSPENVAGATFRSSDDPVRGYAQECRGNWECDAIPEWRVHFARFGSDSTLEGTLELGRADGSIRQGTFRAAWQSRQVFCG